MNQSRELQLAKPEADMAYAMQYEWGVLQATEAAEDAYGFAPLSGTVVRGEAVTTMEDQTLAPFRTDVVLLSPDEFKQAYPDHSRFSAFAEPQILTKSTVHKGGLVVAAAFSHDKDRLHERVEQNMQLISSLTGQDFEDVTDADGVAMPEVLEHEMPQLLVHSLCDTIEQETNKTVVEYLRTHQSEEVMSRMQRMGAIALGGAGIMGAMDVGLSNVNVLSMSVIAGYGLFHANLMRSALKTMLSARNHEEKTFAHISRIVSSMVAGDMHKAYCSKHFDEQIERQFDAN